MKAKKAEKPKFTIQQKKRLGNLGLFQTQIDRLEQHSLPLARSWLRRLPDTTSVRLEMNDLSKFLRAARKKLDELSQASVGSGRQEAMLRIEQAAWDEQREQAIHAQSDYEPIETWKSQVDLILRAVERADLDLPKKKRNTIMTTDHRLIYSIETDISYGWLDEHREYADADKPYPEYPNEFSVSSSQGSVFREIVETCYEAVGVNTGAENAIKNFKRRRDESRRHYWQKAEAADAKELASDDCPKKI